MRRRLLVGGGSQQEQFQPPEEINRAYVLFYKGGNGILTCSTYDDWVNIHSSTETAIGILLYDGDRNLIIPIIDYPKYAYSPSYAVLTDGFSSYADACADFEGKERIKSIILNSSTTPAYYYCATFSIGKSKRGEWWLPTCGELDKFNSTAKTDLRTCLQNLTTVQFNTSNPLIPWLSPNSDPYSTCSEYKGADSLIWVYYFGYALGSGASYYQYKEKATSLAVIPMTDLETITK